ncbi:hypothetical protein Tco_0977722 [Tanacetum coccineum]|uniref:Uncharacterized protein n=1 Tax=Tanacetum coccineum TaxID=301880 RepID=A0ABQ5EKX4_9ASTR
MELNELTPEFKKWEQILCKNVLCLSGNKGHPNGSLSYMIYCLAIEQPFNLAYYMVKRMVSTSHRTNMVLPYAMLPTHLFRHVAAMQPNPLTLAFTLTPHIMVPLRKERVKRNVGKDKKAHPPTDSSSYIEVDGLSSSNLSPRTYVRELPIIESVSTEFKQTKGMLKCIRKTLSKLKKKLEKVRAKGMVFGRLARYGCLFLTL